MFDSETEYNVGVVLIQDCKMLSYFSLFRICYGFIKIYLLLQIQNVYHTSKYINKGNFKRFKGFNR